MPPDRRERPVVFENVTPDGQHTVTEQQLVFTQGTYAFASGTGTNCTFSDSGATATSDSCLRRDCD